MTALWAVHISDGYFHWTWLAFCYIGAIALAGFGLRRLSEIDIVRIALLTAAFFVASSVRVPAGPTSVHLILNGLVGVILGWRAGVAIFLGLLLQFLFAGHGGLTTVGINTCILALPALAAGAIFRGLVKQRWPGRLGRAGLVIAAALAWGIACSVGIELLIRSSAGLDSIRELDVRSLWALSPAGLIVLLAVAGGAALLERRLEAAPLFPVGLLLGVGSVVAASALNCAALYFGAEGDWRVLALVVFLAHLPVAAVEGLILGVTVSYLARVKPDLLGLPDRPDPPAATEPTAPTPEQS